MTTATRARTVNLDELIQPKPKQRQLFEALWRGTLTGNPEYLLFGGAAGPGKSWALRWGAILFLCWVFAKLNLTGVRVGLFSKDYPSLRGRHITAQGGVKAFPAWLGSYNETTHDFTLAAAFGAGVLSLRNMDDSSKYASEEFAAIFVEELTEFDRDDFEELRIRKRWPGVPYSPFVAVCNPRHKGLSWVRKLWIENDFTGERDANLRDRHFWFLQALPSDNDSLPPSYYETLNSLGPVLKRALLEGDWYTVIGQAFPELSPRVTESLIKAEKLPLDAGAPWHVIATDYDRIERWTRTAGHDWGYASPGHHLWGAIKPAGGVVIYREWPFRHLDPEDIADGILYRQGQDEPEVTWADPGIWQERRSSDLTRDQIAALSKDGKLLLSKATQYAAKGLHMQPANNARIAGKGRIHTLLKAMPDGKEPWLQIMDCCPVLIRTLQNIQMDPDKPEDVVTDYLPDDEVRDDPYDTLRYLVMGVPTVAAPARDTPVPRQARWGNG